MRKFLDVSEWQTSIDYAKASKEIDGVIIRAGYGKGNEDKMFKTHYEGFHRVKVPIGIYWFSYATTPEQALAEAQYCISAIHNLEIALPIVYDFEYVSVNYAKGYGVKVTKPLATAMADAFLSEIEKNGYYAMLYSSPNFIKSYYDDSLKRYDLWLANYLPMPDLTNPPQECGIWQYGKGSCCGVTGEVDLNVAYKDYESVIRNAGLNHLTFEPALTGELAIGWATGKGLLLKDEVDVPATKGDIARMLYEYHFQSLPEDSKSRSGLLGG